MYLNEIRDREVDHVFETILPRDLCIHVDELRLRGRVRFAASTKYPVDHGRRHESNARLLR